MAAIAVRAAFSPNIILVKCIMAAGTIKTQMLIIVDIGLLAFGLPVTVDVKGMVCLFITASWNRMKYAGPQAVNKQAIMSNGRTLPVMTVSERMSSGNIRTQQ